jgi:hypothetical protein
MASGRGKMLGFQGRALSVGVLRIGIPSDNVLRALLVDIFRRHSYLLVIQRKVVGA